MHRILVRPTVQLQYGTARFFVEEISKKLEVFLFCEVNYFGTEKWKKNALEKMLNWKRQINFFLTEATSLWKNLFEGVLYKPPISTSKIEEYPFCVLLFHAFESQRKSKSSLNANVSRRLEELFWEVPKNFCIAKGRGSLYQGVYTLCIHLLRIWAEDLNLFQCPKFNGPLNR